MLKAAFSGPPHPSDPSTAIPLETVPEALPQCLRQATRAAHRRLDHHPVMVGLLGRHVSATQLGAALQGLCAAHAALEHWLTPHQADWPGWTPQDWRHTPRLLQALSQMSLRPAEPMPWSLPHSPGLALGVWYVVLGASLGELAIARHLQAVAPDLPGHALAQEARVVHQQWAGFQDAATSAGQEATVREQAICGALAAFDAIAVHLDRRLPQDLCRRDKRL